MDLHWLHVHQRAKFKILTLTYQTYRETVLHYLCHLIVSYVNSCNLRSNQTMLFTPCHPRAKLRLMESERSFQHAAPKEWNNLPFLIGDVTSLANFRSKLKFILLKSAFST